MFAFRLLNLPRELRDKIYADVLEAPGPSPLPPYLPSDSSMREANCNVALYYLLPATVPSNPAIGLLLSGHQIHHEVTELIAHLVSSRRVQYKLDVVYVEPTAQTLQTWISIPVMSLHVARLDIDYSIIGSRGLPNAKDLFFGPQIISLLLRIWDRGLRMESPFRQASETTFAKIRINIRLVDLLYSEASGLTQACDRP